MNLGTNCGEILREAVRLLRKRKYRRSTIVVVAVDVSVVLDV